jgi:hydroxymethylpyrimidine/phosphomethylpyrimidine kinase
VENKRPYVMSIAGYDPSGGAGVLADIKVFEQHKTYGFAVLTSNTLQDDERVRSVEWIRIDDIKKQLDVILNKFTVKVFKMGIMENVNMFMELKDHVFKKDPFVKIVWDPVLASTSGFKFLEGDCRIENLLENILVVTPNLPEFEKLFGEREKALELSSKTAIYLKGGHNDPAQKGVDELFYKGKKIILRPASGNVSSKHGSGCILSSSMAANLALGQDLERSAARAKAYTEKTLASNQTLLAYHN